MTDCLQNGRRPGWWQGGSGRCPMGGGRVLMSHETDECQAFDASAYRNSTHRHLSRNRPSVLSSVFLAMALFRNCRVTGRQIQSQHLIPSTYLKRTLHLSFTLIKGERKERPRCFFNRWKEIHFTFQHHQVSSGFYHTHDTIMSGCFIAGEGSAWPPRACASFLEKVDKSCETWSLKNPRVQ